jgi:hypothetical protein
MENLIDVSKEVDLEVNVGKTKYVLVSSECMSKWGRKNSKQKVSNMRHSSHIWEQQ